MPTAIVRAYVVNEGFAIAADGRVTKDSGKTVVSDSYQKIFPIRDEWTQAAYAISGNTLFTRVDTGEVLWDLVVEATNAMASLQGRKSRTLAGYAVRMSRLINRSLEKAKLADPNNDYPVQENQPSEAGGTIADMLMLGYNNAQPSSIRIRFFHEDQLLAEPQVIPEEITAVQNRADL